MRIARQITIEFESDGCNKRELEAAAEYKLHEIQKSIGLSGIFPLWGDIKNKVIWYLEQEHQELRLMIHYVIAELEVDLGNREIKIPKETKIIDLFYRVHVRDMIYTIGSMDRLMIFNELRDARLKGADMDALKLQYGMNIPDACFTGEVKLVLRALVPKHLYAILSPKAVES